MSEYDAIPQLERYTIIPEKESATIEFKIGRCSERYSISGATTIEILKFLLEEYFSRENRAEERNVIEEIYRHVANQ